MKFQLSERLTKICSLVPSGVILGDIGSDHGYLIASLIKEGIISKGYACDNKKGPFKRLEETITTMSLNDEVEITLSDGMSLLPSYVNAVAICGMGGDLIVNILKKDLTKLENIEYLIIDAHTCVDYIRKEICSLGFYIDDEIDLIEDKVYYQLIRFKKGNSPLLNELDLYYGPILRQKQSIYFKMMIEKRKNKLKSLLDENLSSARREEIKQELERMDNINGDQKVN
ncbi:MAG: SAM-dependent methyltransferase [Bacilli bacterium]|nr:SAM-dependent methyltransferase [Bacilli bacterium]